MLYFKIFEPFKNVISHGISTRHGGVSGGHLDSLNLGLDVGDSEENLQENYRRFCENIGVDGGRLVRAYQRHTDNVLVVDKNNFDELLRAPIEEVDGFITAEKGCALMVRFADCQGVLMFEPDKKIIAAVHSGWRGNAQNIIGKTVEKMVKDFDADPAKILVGISPSLGPCCAEFSDPKNELPEFMHKYLNGPFVDVRSAHARVDLWKCSSDQLITEGVLQENIEIASRCTVCENDKFFSYRGGKKKTGHMGGVICLIGGHMKY